MIHFSAGDEYGEASCDFCHFFEGFYALTEEEFIDEMLASGWTIEGGECKCPECQELEGIVAYMRMKRR